ncbi:hypothetical protein WJX72_006088 [[Myrmecia] bisecta]|uniref:Strawberry notch AAA domain-containing protein n=1 Tax=[Myrmecia] bisecta TaxID=41462 RepID=A0AAW1Q0W9_9CHLO
MSVTYPAPATAVVDAELVPEDLDDIVGDAADNDSVEQEGDLYETYRPAKLEEGQPHPDPIVETASLASMQLPKVTYQHHLQDCAASRGRQIAPRAGFFLGDGAGVGKGRQIAALIKEHWRTGGRRALWVSVSNDLKYDSIRDLEDVGAGGITVFPEGKKSMPSASKRSATAVPEGVVFITYSLLIFISRSRGKDAEDVELGDSTHMPRDMPRGSRLKQIVDWLKGKGEDPLVIFDECHKAKNLIAAKGRASTQTGKAVLNLQNHLPHAKILYSSATGASEPNNLAHMNCLGMAGFYDMIRTLIESGLGALELVTMDPIFKIMYDRAAELWHLLLRILKKLGVGRKTWSLYFSAQQRFFRQMLMASKVPETAKLALDAVEKQGMCVVIGLQSTGEANTEAKRRETGDEMEDFVSAPQLILQQFLENHFPVCSSDLCADELLELQHDAYTTLQRWKDMRPGQQEADARAEPEVPEGWDQWRPGIPRAQAHGGLAWQAAAWQGSSGDDELECVQQGTTSEEREDQKQASMQEALLHRSLAATAKVPEWEELEHEAEARRKDQGKREAKRRALQESGSSQKRPARSLPSTASVITVVDSQEGEEMCSLPPKMQPGKAAVSDDEEHKAAAMEYHDDTACQARGATAAAEAAAKQPAKHTSLKERAAQQRVQGAEEALANLVNPGKGTSPANTDGTSLPPAGRRTRATSRARMYLEAHDDEGKDDDDHDDDDDYVHLASIDSLRNAGLDVQGLDVKPRIRGSRQGTPEPATPDEELYRPTVKNNALGDGWEDELHDQRAPGGNGWGPHPILLHIRGMLLCAVQATELPANPLDQLVHLLGGAGKVAEMTGRRTTLVKKEDGKVVTQMRNTEGAEPAAAASVPVYRIIVTDCAGEFRMASAAAKRLMSLGALLKGDRRAMGAGADLKGCDVENQYGRQTVERVFSDLLGYAEPMANVMVPDVPEAGRGQYSYNADMEDFRHWACKALENVGRLDWNARLEHDLVDPNDKGSVRRFLNRLLAMRLEEQKIIFQYFSETLDAVITYAKSRGKYETGITTIQGVNGAETSKEKLIHTNADSGAQTFSVEVAVDRGLSWEQALKFRNDWAADWKSSGNTDNPRVGFYRDSRYYDFGGTRHPHVLLATQTKAAENSRMKHNRYQRPGNSLSAWQQTEEDLCDKHVKISDAEAKTHWEFWYDYLGSHCDHGDNCTRRRHGMVCTNGQRMYTMYLITGAHRHHSILWRRA